MKIKGLIKTLYRGAEFSYRSCNYRPEGAIVFLTYRCTSKCKTCNIWKRPSSESDELTWNEWKAILNKLAANNVRSLEIFGGDALLRKDALIEMVRHCGKIGIETFLPTNSNLMDEQTARELVTAGLGTVYLSLDEMPSLKDSIRGVDGHFKKVCSSAEYFKKFRGDGVRPKLVCITTVSRLNYHLLDEFIRYADSVPFDAFMLRGISEFNDAAISASGVNGILPEPYFTSTAGSSNLLNHVEARELLRKLQEIKAQRRCRSINVNMENMEILTEENLVKGTYPAMKCHFCTTQIVLTPSGEVVPCLYFNRYVLGELKTQGLSEVWGNKMHREFTAQQRRGGIELCNYCSIKFYHKTFSETVAMLYDKFSAKRGFKRSY